MGYDEQISVLRESINSIDEKLTALFEDRMDAVKEVAELKKRYKKEVFDSDRERAVIERALALLRNKSYSEEVKSLFCALMEVSKKREHKEIKKQIASPSFAGVRVGYLGIKGSFSHTAAEEVFADAALLSYDTFEGMFEGLKNGEIERAILPAENTETGSITAVVDLLAKYGFYIVAEKLLYISHSLLGVKGSGIDGIKVVYSHPEPFGQCSEFLAARPGIETRPSLSTAQAASAVAQTGDKSIGCIASDKAAKVYGLDVIRGDIQNSECNYTRFVVVAPQPQTGEDCDKTSIVFMVEHKPGSLCEILNIFSNGGVNILKLESRPIKNIPFEYMFHLDFEGNINSAGVKKTIEKVKEKAADFILLGCYRREIIS